MNNKPWINHVTGSQSDPIRLLKDEHHVTLLHLALLERSLQYLESLPWNVESERGEREQLRLREGVSRLETDIRRHFAKEEKALFPVLSEYIGSEHGPIGVMLNEHETIRSVFQGWKKIVDELHQHSGTQREVILRAVTASGYEAIRLLRVHISKENQILFEICEASLSPEELRAVAEKIKVM